MPFNISSFKANALPYGGARPSQFNIILTVPSIIGIDSVSVAKFTVSAHDAELPAMKNPAIDVPYFGRKIKVAGSSQEYDDWEVQVYNDEDFSVRSLFETWSNAINSNESNIRMAGLDTENYKTTAEIFQYAKDGYVIRSYIMNGLFPVEVGAIKTKWEDRNQIETFSVKFAYDFWLPNIETSNKQAGGSNTYRAQASIDGPMGPN